MPLKYIIIVRSLTRRFGNFIPPSGQYLVPISKVLNDRSTLTDYEILLHSLITLCIRLRGGVQQPRNKRQREWVMMSHLDRILNPPRSSSEPQLSFSSGPLSRGQLDEVNLWRQVRQRQKLVNFSKARGRLLIGHLIVALITTFGRPFSDITPTRFSLWY